jgi:PhnB protein
MIELRSKKRFTRLSASLEIRFVVIKILVVRLKQTIARRSSFCIQIRRATTNNMKSAGVYLTFDGNCAEAFAHYSTVFKQKLCVSMTNGESPMKDEIPAELHHQIMHCSLDVGLGEAFAVMGSDYNPKMCASEKGLVVGTNTCITLVPSTKEETDRLFTELSQDGKVLMPMAEAFWGSYAGAFVDKFGIHWMLDFPIAEKQHVLEKYVVEK